MLSESRSRHLAVLIDADNTSAKIVDALFKQISKIGEASVRRIYGDFSDAHSEEWAANPSLRCPLYSSKRTFIAAQTNVRCGPKASL